MPSANTVGLTVEPELPAPETDSNPFSPPQRESVSEGAVCSSIAEKSVVAAFHLTQPAQVLQAWRSRCGEAQDAFLAIESEDALGEHLDSALTLLCTSRDDDVIATYQLIKHLTQQELLKHGPTVCICAGEEAATIFSRLNNACERYLGVSCQLSQWPPSRAAQEPMAANEAETADLPDLPHSVLPPDEKILPPVQKTAAATSPGVSLPPVHQTIPIETFPEDDIWLTRLLAEQAVMWLPDLHGPVVLDVRLPDRLDERGKILVDGQGRLWGVLASLNDDAPLLTSGLILRHWINEHARLLADVCRGVYVDADRPAGLILATAATAEPTLQEVAAETPAGDILTRRIHFLTRGLSRALLVV